MAILTAAQLARLQAIIRDASVALAVTTMGYEVPDEELQRLIDEGYIDPADLENIVLDSFAFGQLRQKMPAVRAHQMSYPEFEVYLKGHPVSLSDAERHAYDVAKLRGGTFCVGLGNRFSEELGRVVVEADQELATRTRTIIADETARNIATRETKKQLKSRLGKLTGEWTRDWDRIAHTETHLAHQEGFLSATIERYGEGELLAKMPEPGACEHCKRLYLGPDGKPIIRPASWWAAHGTTNVGRRAKDWRPVLGAMHPWCRCVLVRVPAGFGFDEAGVLVPTGLEKSAGQGGPFIGPRGGKWADPEHTIPWEEHQFTAHALIGGQSHHYVVAGVKEDQVKLARHGGTYGPWMPRASVKHFVNDLQGKVDVPPSDHPGIEAVRTGEAKFLGKGDDGLAFKHGDQVVKVSTTVPYQPDNPGHRTPEQAAEMLRGQVETGNKLADLGVPGVQRSKFVQHGDKGFQIRDHVEIPERFTREQLDQIQDSVLAMHAHGYALHDDVQAGLDKDGKPVLFDVGKVGPIQTKEGVYADTRSDIDNLRRLYQKNGQEFVKRGQTEGQEQLEHLSHRWDAMIAPGKNLGFARKRIEGVEAQLRKEAEAVGDKAKRAELEKEIENSLWAMRVELEHLENQARVTGAEQAIATKAAAESPEERFEKARKLEGRITFQGFPISIETRAGSVREWYDVPTKTHGQTVMRYPYGYIRLTEGMDGDHVDVFVGPDETATHAYVVHQLKAPAFKAFDEDKVMLGFPSAEDAREAYLAHYDRPEFFGGMTALPITVFRRKVHRADGEMIKAEQLGFTFTPQQGPFIGPRGGKWADAAHTIPWKPKKGRAPRVEDLGDGYTGTEIKPGMSIEQAEDAIRKAPVEHLAVFLDGQVAHRVRGKVNEAEITRDVAQKIKAHGGAVVTHNHPSGTTFSAEDLLLAICNNVKEMRATIPGGGAWVLKRPGDRWDGRFAEVPGAESIFEALETVRGRAMRQATLMMDWHLESQGGTAGDASHPAFSQEKFNEFCSNTRFDAFNRFLAPSGARIEKISDPVASGAGDARSESRGAHVPAQKAMMLEAWEKAVRAAGIPLEKFALIVKYARAGHAEARKALDAVYADLVKASPDIVPAVTGAVATMGHHSQPARTAGANVQNAPLIADWPVGREDAKRRRKKRKVVAPEDAPTVITDRTPLVPAAMRVGMLGRTRGDGGWTQEYAPERVVASGKTERTEDAEQAREDLESQQARRASLRQGSKLNTVIR